MSINTRLSKLEQRAEAERPELGWLRFNTADKEHYYRVESGSYHSALICADGNNPEGIRSYTREELKELEHQGWNIAIVEWVKDWRGAMGGPVEEEPADIQRAPGYQ